MARSLDSLSYFLKAVIEQKPWNYDPSCDPIAWRDITLPKSLTIGVMRDDGCHKLLFDLSQVLFVLLLLAQGHLNSRFLL